VEQHDAEDGDGPQPGDLGPKLTCHGLRIAIASGSSRARIHGWFSNQWTQIIAAKIRRNLVYGDEFPSTRRARDVDQTRNLLWFSGRPHCSGSSPIFCPQLRDPREWRAVDINLAVIVVPQLPAGGRRLMETASVPGARFRRRVAAQALGASRRRALTAPRQRDLTRIATDIPRAAVAPADSVNRGLMAGIYDGPNF